MRWNRAALLPFLIVGLSGCGVTDPVACTAQFVYGLSITVLDSSGAPAAEGAVGTAVDGTFQETLEVFGPDAMVGAGERPGTYDITITKDGYGEWSATNVVVDSDVCHVIPVALEARLEPVP